MEIFADLSLKDKQEFLRERKQVRMLERQKTTEQRLSIKDVPGQGTAGSRTGPVWRVSTGKRQTVK